jgi:LPXTG-site transpeptidase (sortase) family protein
LFNLSSLVSQVNAWFVKPEDEVVLNQDLGAFYSWIGGYYFAVTDKTLLEPNNDVDKDGLSNLDEFVIRTNPTIADSDGDGEKDGEEVMNSTNPWGKGDMTAAQLKLREKMDIIKINNRITFNTVSIADRAQADPSIDYDFSKPGRLSIPRLDMQVPLIWTQDPSQFDTDLTKGVVHYPGTALPGEKGTVYISGHSSDYFWKNHPFKQVFAKINVLQPGDDIFVDIYGKDGKTYTYRYQVSEKNVFKPDDQAQFIDNSQYKLNLSTCWPIGTQRDRYVVSATMVPL